jgi:DNA-binding XRE family transcriptional regulator
MTFRELLKSCDCTASRLARAVGVSRQAVQFWIDGTTVPSVDKAAKIAEVLGVKLERVAACFV